MAFAYRIGCFKKRQILTGMPASPFGAVDGITDLKLFCNRQERIRDDLKRSSLFLGMFNTVTRLKNVDQK